MGVKTDTLGKPNKTKVAQDHMQFLLYTASQNMSRFIKLKEINAEFNGKKL